jgi:hypothetical protein
VIDPRPGIVYHADAESLWRRSRGASDLLAAARHVRARLASDPAVPRPTRAMIPMLAALQTVLILVVRPAFQAVRGRPS